MKRVNDRHGHAAGDTLIKQFARCLRESTREADVCARLGGDEFTMLLYDATADDAARVTDRVTST